VKKIEGYEVTITSSADSDLSGIPHEVVAVSDNQHLLKVPTVDAIEHLIARSKAQHFQVESIVPQRQTLEDLYMKRVK
jgi:hypothetical protein